MEEQQCGYPAPCCCDELHRSLKQEAVTIDFKVKFEFKKYIKNQCSSVTAQSLGSGMESLGPVLRCESPSSEATLTMFIPLTFLVFTYFLHYFSVFCSLIV